MIWARLVSAFRRLRFGISNWRHLDTWPSTVTLGKNVRIFAARGGRIRIGQRVTLMDDVILEVGAEGEISIGDEVWIHVGTILSARQSVHVGRSSLVGEYASIRDADHETAASASVRSQGFRCAAVVIGSDVWIGRGVAVLRGVSIGDGSIIGANAVVTADVPEGKIAAGVPSRVIGDRQ